MCVCVCNVCVMCVSKAVPGMKYLDGMPTMFSMLVAGVPLPPSQQPYLKSISEYVTRM